MYVTLFSMIAFAAFITYVIDQSGKAMIDMYREFLQELLK